MVYLDKGELKSERNKSCEHKKKVLNLFIQHVKKTWTKKNQSTFLILLSAD